jgi:hypothetical protein
MRSRTLAPLSALGLAALPAMATPAQAGGRATPSFVFTSDRDGDLELFVRWTDGRTTRLTRNRVADSSAAWSPDGPGRMTERLPRRLRRTRRPAAVIPPRDGGPVPPLPAGTGPQPDGRTRSAPTDPN